MALKRLQMTSPSMARRLFLCMVAPVVEEFTPQRYDSIGLDLELLNQPL